MKSSSIIQCDKSHHHFQLDLYSEQGSPKTKILLFDFEFQVSLDSRLNEASGLKESCSWKLDCV